MISNKISKNVLEIMTVKTAMMKVMLSCLKMKTIRLKKRNLLKKSRIMNLPMPTSLNRRLKPKTKATYLINKKKSIKLKRIKYKIATKADLC